MIVALFHDQQAPSITSPQRNLLMQAGLARYKITFDASLAAGPIASALDLPLMYRHGGFGERTCFCISRMKKGKNSPFSIFWDQSSGICWGPFRRKGYLPL